MNAYDSVPGRPFSIVKMYSENNPQTGNEYTFLVTLGSVNEIINQSYKTNFKTFGHPFEEGFDEFINIPDELAQNFSVFGYTKKSTDWQPFIFPNLNQSAEDCKDKYIYPEFPPENGFEGAPLKKPSLNNISRTFSTTETCSVWLSIAKSPDTFRKPDKRSKSKDRDKIKLIEGRLKLPDNRDNPARLKRYDTDPTNKHENYSTWAYEFEKNPYSYSALIEISNEVNFRNNQERAKLFIEKSPEGLQVFDGNSNTFALPPSPYREPGRFYIKLADVIINPDGTYNIEYFWRSNLIAPIRFIRMGSNSRKVAIQTVCAVELQTVTVEEADGNPLPPVIDRDLVLYSITWTPPIFLNKTIEECMNLLYQESLFMVNAVRKRLNLVPIGRGNGPENSISFTDVPDLTKAGTSIYSIYPVWTTGAYLKKADDKIYIQKGPDNSSILEAKTSEIIDFKFKDSTEPPPYPIPMIKDFNRAIPLSIELVKELWKLDRSDPFREAGGLKDLEQKYLNFINKVNFIGFS